MREEPSSPLQARLPAGRDTRLLLGRLSPLPARDRCKLSPGPGDLRASLRARLGCPATRHDASCRAFCWAVGTAGFPWAWFSAASLIVHYARTRLRHPCSHQMHTRVPGCSSTSLPCNPLGSFVSSVPRAESPVALRGRLCFLCTIRCWTGCVTEAGTDHSVRQRLQRELLGFGRFFGCFFFLPKLYFH